MWVKRKFCGSRGSGLAGGARILADVVPNVLPISPCCNIVVGLNRDNGKENGNY